ncbi:MAG TPA: hypothetical protein VIF15_09455 [Polyangiaceae bacterium]|jgi:hypothetical protein
MKTSDLVLACSVWALAGCSSNAADAGSTGGGAEGGEADGAADAPLADSQAGDSPVGDAGSRADGGTVDDAGAAACAAAALALCTKESTCWPDLVEQLYGDVQTCAARGALSCHDELAAPGTGWTASIETACTDAIVAGSCTDYFDGVLPSACLPAAGGSVGALGVCAGTVQCAAGSSCLKASGSSCGNCTAEATTAGASCTTADCASGLVCVSGVCAAWVPVGGACGAGNPCSFPNYCAGGICTAGSTLGASCTTTSDTCDRTQGLYCRASSKKCEAYLFADAGQPCGVLTGGRTVCKGGGLCMGLSATVTKGTCIPPAKEGAACNVTAGPPCMRPAICASGVCTLPDSSTCH